MANLMGPKAGPPPASGPAPGAQPATGALVLDFANFRGALNVLLSDFGNFLGFGLAVQIGTSVAVAVCVGLAVLLALAVPFLGVLVGAALFLVVGSIIPFTAYAVLVKKLRTGTFDWSAWGQGFSRYFAVVGPMVGLQIVALAPAFVYLLISGTSLFTVFAAMRHATGGLPLSPALGLPLIGLLGLVFLVVQVWWLARLLFASGLILLGNRSLGQAVSESLAATGPLQWQVLVYGLAIVGVFVAVGILEGLLGQVPFLNGIVFALLGALQMMWMWLVVWMVYRDNYGLGEAE